MTNKELNIQRLKEIGVYNKWRQAVYHRFSDFSQQDEVNSIINECLCCSTFYRVIEMSLNWSRTDEGHTFWSHIARRYD